MESHEQRTIPSKIERIRILNDRFRRNGRGGIVMMTQGIKQMLEYQQLLLMEMIRQYTDFSRDNDPYGEHDMGSIEINDETVFWKIDYYDLDLEYGSRDPTDPDVTLRVMTIMLACEY